jgi:KDO2-lipid IV(A) lauroyltransferase
MFNKVLEDYVRRDPGQWLWIHRRWKTRPEGEAPLY